VTREAKEEIQQMRGRLDAMHADNQTLLENNARLEKVVHEKTRVAQQTHLLYQKLKCQQQALGLEDAADQGAEDILNHAGIQQQQQQQPTTGRPSGGSGNVVRSRSNGGGGHRQSRTQTWPQGGGAQGYPAAQAFQPGQSHRSNLGTSRLSHAALSLSLSHSNTIY
jgi:hypothetical protein